MKPIIRKQDISTRGALAFSLITLVAVAPGKSDLLQLQSAAAAENVVLCHKAGTRKQKTLQVAPGQVAAHLKHGDRRGACKKKKNKTKGRD